MISRLLKATSGIWSGEDGLAYQQKLRAEWQGRCEPLDFAEPWMDEEEAQAFREEIRASMADFEAGRVIDGVTLIAELRDQLPM